MTTFSKTSPESVDVEFVASDQLIGPLTYEQARREHIRKELGKWVPKGEVVVDYRIEGFSGAFSGVDGKIIVATSSSAEESDLGEKVIGPDKAWNAIDIDILVDLRSEAAAWHEANTPKVETIWQRDYPKL